MTSDPPQGSSFHALKVRRCDDDAIDLDMDLVHRIGLLNNWDFGKIRINPAPVVSTILHVWHMKHLAQHGHPDAVMESFRLQSEIAHDQTPN